MDFFDQASGMLCANCESRTVEPGSLFCDSDCRDEYEGTGEYAEPPEPPAGGHEEHEDRYDIDTLRDTQEA